MNTGRGKLVALAFIAVLVLPTVLASQKAFADGLTQENLPPASFGDQQASLFVKINPPILTTESKQDAYLQFRLFDAKTNETIKFPTLNIAVYKGTDPNAKPLMQDFFQSENGLLTIKVKPQEGDVQVQGNREPFLNALKADPGGTVNISGPVLLDGGLYRIDVSVFGIKYPTNIFKDEDVKTFETALSVGDVYSQNVQSEGKTYPMSIISYYDKVEDFKFNAASKTYSWAMPFNWNTSRIQNAPNVFVHEEVRVPKSFTGVGDASAFDAKVNGKPIAGRMLAVDPFSDENNLILHFLINKNDILDMARNSPPSDGKMSFSFSPAGASEGQQTSGEISTDTGGIHALLNWTPGQLKAGAETKLDIQFVDAFAGTNISDQDVKYDLKIFDKNGKEVLAKTDQTAQGGKGEQAGLNFPADDTYRVEITVNGLVKQGQSPDLTRNGIARGIVVVPEFPAGAMVAVAGAIGAIVVAQRLMTTARKNK
ncbi:peptidase [Candidatus Nitrososphaera evergladensis]|uniref:peptidase n=1 Tax=Candidatus Nitrososphaera evergladensis TaxID=1459637 RepID=UPI0011E598A0|nr:peptidase [Candidatus Nitrososphaera evergladensis]